MIALLTVSYALSVVDRYVVSLLIEPIRADLLLSDVEIAVVTGFGFALFYTAAGLYLGRLADQANRRTLIVAGVLAWSVATAASGLARNFVQLLVARGAVAIGEASLSPAAYSIIGDTFAEHQRPQAAGVYFMGAAIGPGLALVVGAGLLKLAAGAGPISLPGYGVLQPWQMVLLLLAVLGVVWTGIVRLLLVDPPRAPRGPDLTKPGLSELRDTFVELRPVLAPFFGAVALFSLFGNGLMAWAATYLVRAHGWSLSEAGVRLGIGITIAGALGAGLAGWLASRELRRGRADGMIRVAVALSMTAVPLGIFATLIGRPWLSLLAISLTMMASIGVSSLAPAIAAFLVPAHVRGRMVALYLLVVGLFSVGGGPLLVSLFTEQLFGDHRAVGRAIALLGALTLPVTAWLFVRTLRAYRRL